MPARLLFENPDAVLQPPFYASQKRLGLRNLQPFDCHEESPLAVLAFQTQERSGETFAFIQLAEIGIY